MSALLSTHGLTAHYGQFQALFGVDIHLNAGECIAIIGANGAGKTTLMRSISGVLKNDPDSVCFQSQPIGGMAAEDIVQLGISMVPEGRKLFPSLSVEENLLVGADANQTTGYWTLERIYELFPVLAERRNTPPTALSGGQQQMAAIGRALMSNPKVLLCDEISLGLAPVVIKDIYKVVPEIRESGASLIIVEQDINQALNVADRAYCMMEGKITLSGPSSELSRDAIHQAYFGVAA
jgi:branched-chain amino acid transport system ATP-binding protein